MRKYPDWQAVPAGDLLTVSAAARLAAPINQLPTREESAI